MKWAAELALLDPYDPTAARTARALERARARAAASGPGHALLLTAPPVFDPEAQEARCRALENELRSAYAAELERERRRRERPALVDALRRL